MSPVPHAVALAEFRAQAQTWLSENLPRRTPRTELRWGEGSDDVAVFKSIPHDEEAAVLRRNLDYQRLKFEAGFGAISWPVEYGGRGLPREFERAFRSEEAAFETPLFHEAVTITFELVPRTVLRHGTHDQKLEHVASTRHGDHLWCMLFSEPDAGSDLAGVTTHAIRRGSCWVLNGRKVWTSGAQFSRFGYALCRTDVNAPKHAGLTAFLVPMDSPGVEVRPLRQMTGGASFNEVLLDGVEVSNEHVLGRVGGGWDVARWIPPILKAAASFFGAELDRQSKK